MEEGKYLQNQSHNLYSLRKNEKRPGVLVIRDTY